MMKPRNVDKVFVFAIGPLPPPIHGAAATTKHFLDYAAGRTNLYASNVARGTSGGVGGQIVKATRVFFAVLQLAWMSFGNHRRVLYMAADGGRGLLYNILAACCARLFRYPIFLHHHSFAYIDSYSPLMACLSRIMGRAGTHVVLCDVMAKGLRDRYGALLNARMIELSSAAFVEVKPREGLRNGIGIRLGFLSNLIVEKGLDTSIALLRAALSEGLPVRLILAGKKTDRRSSDIVDHAQKEFEASIEYLGVLSEQEKMEFFYNIDAFVFPTRYVNEAQPRAILESLFFGVPVLTIARSCITGDVGRGGGKCVPPAADFVSAALPLVRSWCADREELRRSSQEAADRAVVLHDLGLKHVSELVDAFERVGSRPF